MTRRSHCRSPAAEIGTDGAWLAYLSQLEEPGGRFARSHVDAVRAVWSHCRTLTPSLQTPQTAPTESGLLSLTWDSGDHHLEVDIAQDRGVEWFYLNRSTGVQDIGECGDASSLPASFDENVRRFAPDAYLQTPESWARTWAAGDEERPINDARAREIRAVKSRFLDILTAAQKFRRTDPDWIVREQRAMLDAVNDERARRGLRPGLTLGDLQRIELVAVGHSDYSSKFALYCAEAATDPGWTP